VRSKKVHQIHSLVRAYLDVELEMLTYPVDIKVSAYYDRLPVDSDNILAKVYIDPLKGWWIYDDKLIYVREVSTQSYPTKGEPYVEITLNKAQDNSLNPVSFRCRCGERFKDFEKFIIHTQKECGMIAEVVDTSLDDV
jgi:hypothetical protein